MDWRVWSVDTITGRKLNMLPFSAFPWARVLNDKGSGRATLQLTRNMVDELDVKDLTREVDRTLVLERKTDSGYKVVYGGIIWDTEYARSTGTLTLGHADIWSMLSKRFLLERHDQLANEKTLAFWNVTLGTLAKLIVTNSTNAAPRFNLPIFYPANEDGGESRTFYGYHLSDAYAQLQEIMEVSGGPDIDFEPYWNEADELRWQMRIGNLTAGSYEWNTASGRTGATDIVVKTDANQNASHVYGKGEGSGVDAPFRFAESAGTGPALESTVAFSKENSLARLQSLTNAERDLRSKPIQQWGFNIMITESPTVTDLRLGGTARLHFQDDLWIPNGWHNNRVIGFSGDLSNKVSLDLQPMGA